MKPANIALFKRFLKSNGANIIFRGMYKQFHFEDMPEDVEQYLKDVDCVNAIFQAFKFPENLNTFGPDYWTEMAVKWDALVKKATTQGYYTAIPRIVERYQREADTPIERFDKDLKGLVKLINGRPIEEVEQEKQQKKQHQQPPQPPRTQQIDEEEAAVSGFNHPALNSIGTFEFFDLGKDPVHRLKDDIISINNKKGSCKLTFNKTVTQLVQERGLGRYRIGQDNTTGEVRILFGNFEDGYTFTITKSTNLTIANKKLIDILMRVFKVNGEYGFLKLSKNLANDNKYLVYRITKE